jgi:hypothetical protein
VGLDAAPAWLAVDEVLSFFGSTTEKARSELERLVQNEHLLVSDTDEMPVPS